MKDTIKISPSILSADFARLGEEIRALCQAGADYIHVDVMDGHFVPNITIGPCVIEQIKKHSTVPLDVHLMISRPDKYVKDFINAGADLLTLHVEAEGFHVSLIEQIKSYGLKAGIAISPATDVRVLDDLINIVDLVLIMTVEPGFANQKFLSGQLEKIRAVKVMAGPNLLIAVDGGINEDTAFECVKAGANILVAGSYVFRAKNYKENIDFLRSNAGISNVELII
jgi:ribulose-phosphate 3-epimerase